MVAWFGRQVVDWKRFIRVIPLLFEVRREKELVLTLRSYLGSIPLCLFSEPLRWLWMLAATRRRFQHPEQRPLSLYAPHLSATPFPHPNDTSRFLEQHVEAIRDEFARTTHEVESPSKMLLSRGDWHTFALVRAARRIQENIDLCPTTWAVVDACPRPPEGVRGGVYFSILDPDTHITPHCGPSNLKHRYHLTIAGAEGARIRSGATWRTWARGECLILDDSFEHEVVHEGETRRVVLIVDCWHSDLTQREKEFVTILHLRFH